MGTASLRTINTHVVDILGNVKGRDQPIMMLDKAIELVSRFSKDIFLDRDTVFFDPFCKAGEILLACAMTTCRKQVEETRKLVALDEVERELYESKRYFAMSPDERHHILERMGQRDFSVEDIINVLLSPSMRVSPGEPHVKGWTYRCSTGRYRVVVAFTQLADGLYLITVMDLTKRN